MVAELELFDGYSLSAVGLRQRLGLRTLPTYVMLGRRYRAAVKEASGCWLPRYYSSLRLSGYEYRRDVGIRRDSGLIDLGGDR